MRNLTILLLSMLILAGCTTTKMVKQEISSDELQAIDYRELNSDLEGTSATIWLMNGGSCEAEIIHVAADSIEVADWTHHPEKKIATEKIWRVVSLSSQGNRAWTLLRWKDPGAYAGITRDLRMEPVRLELSDGSEIETEAVRINIDTTTYADLSLPLSRRIPTSMIGSIEKTSRTAGAIRGFFLGLLGGGVFGYGLGKTLTDDNSESSWPVFRVFLITSGSALVGTIGGVVYGTVNGLTTQYILQH